jgi:hypothetical protein
MKYIYLVIALLFCIVTPIFAAEVKNLQMGQTDTKGYVTYDLYGKVGEKDAEIKVSVSINGEQYPAEKLSLSGDLGKGIKVGTGKRIWWDVFADLPAGLADGDLVWEVVVVDNQVQETAPATLKPARASIGISIRELTSELRSQLKLKDDYKGVVVSEVKTGSSAEDAGIVRGDLVLELNGQSVNTLEQFATLAVNVKKGEVVRLLLRRPDDNFFYVAISAQ